MTKVTCWELRLGTPVECHNADFMKPETRNPKPLLPRHVLLNTTLTVLLLAYALPSTLAEPLEISVTGSNFQWHIVYPGRPVDNRA